MDGPPRNLPVAAMRAHWGRSRVASCERHCAVLLKWGRSTLAFFPMRNTHMLVCRPPHTWSWVQVFNTFGC